MNGQYYAIEATGIGGEGLGGIASAQDAFKKGMKEIGQFIKAAQSGDPRYSLIDINNMNAAGVNSMSLDDNAYLREKVDKIAENFTEQKPSKNYANNQPRRGSNGNKISGNRFPGPLSFSIPSGWQTYSNPIPQIPILTAQVASPDQEATVSIYDIPASSPQQAMNTIANYFYNIGLNVEYNLNGNFLSGNTYGGGTVFKWKGKIGRTSSGYRIVAVGADSRIYNQYAGTVNSIFNSIK